MAEATQTAQKPTFRRRKILVQPGYQLRVAAIVLLHIIGYSLLLGFLIFFPLHQELDAVTDPDQQFWIARQVLELHMRFWPSVLVIAVLVAAQSIYVTHRIVGPAYHIRRVLTGLADGKLALRVRLRRWDRLKEIEEAANRLAERLEGEERSRATEREQICAALAEARAALGEKSDVAAARQALGHAERVVTKSITAS